MARSGGCALWGRVLLAVLVGAYGAAETNVWTQPLAVPAGAGVRFHHSCTMYSGLLFVFGGATAILEEQGRGQESRVVYTSSDTLWRYHLRSRSWFEVPKHGLWPGPRVRQVSVRLGNSMVVYGGAATPEVWALNLTSPFDDAASHPLWREFNPALHPAARSDCSASGWDGNKMIVFGGCATAGLETPPLFCTPMGDTWVWYADHGRWASVTTARAPSARFAHSGVTLGRSAYIFGGIASEAAYAGDPFGDDQKLWRIDLDQIPDAPPASGVLALDWTPVPAAQPEDAPPSLAWAQALAHNGSVLVLGGRPSPAEAPSNAVWRFWPDTSGWSHERPPDQTPEWPRRFALCADTVEAEAIASTEETVVAMGGAAPLRFFDDIWLYATATNVWIQSQARRWPSSRFLSSGALVGGSYYLSGGFDFRLTTTLSDVWRFDTTASGSLGASSWSLVRAESEVLAFGHACLSFRDRDMLCFAGSEDFSTTRLSNRAHVFHTANRAWVEARVADGAATPPPMNKMGFVNSDSEGPDVFHTFGGSNATLAFSDLWRLRITGSTATGLAAEWRLLGNAASAGGARWPPPRNDAAMFALKGRLYVYGGTTGPSLGAPALGDCWAYDLGRGAWRLLDATAPPGKRFFASVAHVPPGVPGGGGPSKVALFGGVSVLNDGNGLTSVWVATAAASASDPAGGLAWTEVQVRGTPVHRFGHVATVVADHKDPTTAAMLVFSGHASVDVANQEFASRLVPSIAVGCNPGLFSGRFADEPCTPCPRGTFRSNDSPRCEPCAGDSWTAEPGASDPASCNVCEPGFCDHHGTCTLTAAQTASCTCHIGYSGEQCETNSGLIGGLVSMAATIVVISAAVVAVRLRRGFKATTALYETLLTKSTAAMEELERAFEIDSRDLQFDDKIGEGGYGDVWHGTWQDRDVAIKVLRQNVMALDDAAVNEFVEESKLMRLLRHQNIVLFWGAGVLDARPFLVTEYMSLGSLREVLGNSTHSLPWDLRVRMALDGALGLEFLHQQSPPRLHRDVKSDNFLVASNWRLKLADFGTARLLSSLHLNATSFSSTSGVDNLTSNVGTLCWAAPEVLAGEPYGLKADVYSLGIVFWEMVSRQLPYIDLKSPFAIRSAVTEGRRPKMPERLPVAALPFCDVVRRAWRADPNARPHAAQIAQLLHGLHASLSADALATTTV